MFMFLPIPHGQDIFFRDYFEGRVRLILTIRSSKRNFQSNVFRIYYYSHFEDVSFHIEYLIKLVLVYVSVHRP